MFDKLTAEAKAHCIDEYYNRVFPYDTEGTLEDLTPADHEYNIKTTLECCEELTIDQAGNWYFEGERI